MRTYLLVIAIGALLLSPAALAQNVSANESTIRYQWIGEYFLIISNFTIWCEGKREIELFGGRAICNLDKSIDKCVCRLELPKDQVPAHFVAVEQIEARFQGELDDRDKSIQNATTTIWALGAMIIVSLLSFWFYVGPSTRVYRV